MPRVNSKLDTWKRQAMSDTVSIGGISVRNVRRVKTDDPGYEHGYSYEFEALRGDVWIKFGPQVFGNWSVASDVNPQRVVFPRSEYEEEMLGLDRDAVYIGWYDLEDLTRLGEE